MEKRWKGEGDKSVKSHLIIFFHHFNRFSDKSDTLPNITARSSMKIKKKVACSYLMEKK